MNVLQPCEQCGKLVPGFSTPDQHSPECSYAQDLNPWQEGYTHGLNVALRIVEQNCTGSRASGGCCCGGAEEAIRLLISWQNKEDTNE